MSQSVSLWRLARLIAQTRCCFCFLLCRLQAKGDLLLRQEETEIPVIEKKAQELLAKEYQAPVKTMPCEGQRHECLQCYKDNKHVSFPSFSSGALLFLAERGNLFPNGSRILYSVLMQSENFSNARELLKRYVFAPEFALNRIPSMIERRCLPSALATLRIPVS